MNVSKSYVVVKYRSLADRTTYLQSVALLVMRLGIGLELWFTSRGHLHIVPTMVERFTNWGVPFPKLNVYLSAWTEGICGLLLVAGLATRLASIPLIFNFCVAYLTASRAAVVKMLFGPGHWEGVSDVVDDTAMPFLVASLVTLAFGAGKISLDYVLARWTAGGKQVAEITPA